MNHLAVDAIAIDTNVFVHLFNDENNTDGHIDDLLQSLMVDRLLLHIDDGGFIENEYDEKLDSRRGSDDTGNRIQLLRYWMAQEIKHEVEVDRTGELMRVIKEIIHEPGEGVDRTFVAVALISDVVLISNDDEHILSGPKTKRGKDWIPRRRRILRDTRKLRPRNDCEILSSNEAQGRL